VDLALNIFAQSSGRCSIDELIAFEEINFQVAFIRGLHAIDLAHGLRFPEVRRWKVLLHA
jgi:hypothetical protein